jgi:hypothetical protein
VASSPFRDLFVHAKDLFMGAKQVGRAMLTPSGQSDWAPRLSLLAVGAPG